jgi:hypothetical protein
MLFKKSLETISAFHAPKFSKHELSVGYTNYFCFEASRLLALAPLGLRMKRPKHSLQYPVLFWQEIFRPHLPLQYFGTTNLQNSA